MEDVVLGIFIGATAGLSMLVLFLRAENKSRLKIIYKMEKNIPLNKEQKSTVAICVDRMEN